MRQYIGELVMLGITTFALTLTGISVNQQQTPEYKPDEKKSIDSITQDTKLKTLQIKMLLSNTRQDTISKIKKSRIAN